MTTDIDIREVLPNEHELLGQLMVEVYSNLDGFPSKNEQPGYYEMLANIGSLMSRKIQKSLWPYHLKGSCLYLDLDSF